MIYDRLVLFAVIVIIGYCIHLIADHLRKHKRRKHVPQQKIMNSRAAMLWQYAGQQLWLNLMAMEAVRELSAAAAKQQGTGKSRKNS